MLSLFRDLDSSEEEEFRQWARDNFEKDTEPNELWHPVVRDEWKVLQAMTLAQKAERHEAGREVIEWEPINTLDRTYADWFLVVTKSGDAYQARWRLDGELIAADNWPLELVAITHWAPWPKGPSND